MYKGSEKTQDYRYEGDNRCEEVQENKCVSNELEKAISRLLECNDMATKSLTVLRGSFNTPCNSNEKCGEPSICEFTRRINEIALELGDKLGELSHLL